MPKNLHLQTFTQSWQLARRQKQHRLAQGRLTANEAASRLPDSGEMPLARLPVSHGATPTVYATAENRGHLLIVAPPGSLWREQLRLTLSHWPGAALVVDPDGQLYRQTAAFRQALYGVVYAHPGYRLRFNNLLRLWHEEVAFQLHQLLMPELSQADSSSDANHTATNRTVSLFCAIGFYSLAHKCNPFQLLLDVALTDMLSALAALETVPQARLHVRHFSKGQPPQLAIYDEATVQAFSWFSHQLWRYQEAYATFALPPVSEGVVPEQWFREKKTLYLTYTTSQMAEMAGLVAAIVHSQLLAHQTFGGGRPLLLVLDAALANRLPHFTQFLTTASDYGITVVLTAPSLTALDALTPTGSGETLAGQFGHQLWYVPRDRETAVHISTRYGTSLDKSGELVPALSAEEVLGWADEALLLVTRQERPYVFLGQPVKLPEDFPQRQPPLLPTPGAKPRSYDKWLPLLPSFTMQIQAALIDKGAMADPAEKDTAAAKKELGAGETAVLPEPVVPPESRPEPPGEEDEASEKSLNIVRTKFR
ncbi:MAG: hypothetical protein CL608_11505 [Anaerolineaceae bacterium]|nr:hypothetical protein [Anaerolineaceae bacterium]